MTALDDLDVYVEDGFLRVRWPEPVLEGDDVVDVVEVPVRTFRAIVALANRQAISEVTLAALGVVDLDVEDRFDG